MILDDALFRDISWGLSYEAGSAFGFVHYFLSIELVFFSTPSDLLSPP